MAKWVDAGENATVDVLFGSMAVWANTYLGMYTDAAEPAENAGLPTQANPITEVSGAGYARKTLARGSWTITGDYAQYAQQTFTATGGVLVERLRLLHRHQFGQYREAPLRGAFHRRAFQCARRRVDQDHAEDHLCIGTGGKEVYMAVGDVVSSGLSSIASGAYLDLRPSAGVEWVLHNIYYGGRGRDFVL